MCGRFMFEPDSNAEIKRIYDLATGGGYHPKVGEVFPTDETALIVPGDRQVRVVSMKWGFPGFKRGQSIINDRSETVQSKKMFANAFATSRCVYPTTGFFEWSQSKDKYRFNYRDQPDTLFIGGCFKNFSDGLRSVLFTTEPNESMIQIHDRMPLILTKRQINAWIFDDNFANDFLNSSMPQLFSESVSK